MPTTYERFGGLCAVLAGVFIFLYSVAFVVIARSDPALGGLLSALFLLISGLLVSAVLVALYERLRPVDPSFALWALLLGVVAALGSAIHGGYDLANAINPPTPPNVDLPSAIDPRGLLTFGIAGLATAVIAWLMSRSDRFPRALSSVGYLLAVLLIVIYLARLIVLSATSPIIVIPILVTGFLVNPVWHIWLGRTFLRGRDVS
jgi:hypothetical protein